MNTAASPARAANALPEIGPIDVESWCSLPPDSDARPPQILHEGLLFPQVYPLSKQVLFPVIHRTGAITQTASPRWRGYLIHKSSRNRRTRRSTSSHPPPHIGEADLGRTCQTEPEM